MNFKHENSNNNTKHYYTLTPLKNDYCSWQPESKINTNIQTGSNIISNWKYRQYIQQNANQIMKYNTMENIYSSGNNPYSISNNAIDTYSKKSPYLFSSVQSPSIGFNNSDLKQEYVKQTQLKSRMVAPSIKINK